MSASRSVRLVRKGRLLVAVPESDVKQRTAGEVEETRRALAFERDRRNLTLVP